MRRHLLAAGGLALLGLALGVVWAEHRETLLWPRLEELARYRGGALGWTAGAALGVLLSWLLPRRASAGSARRPLLGWAFLLVLALAPLGVAVVQPRGTLSQALALPRRASGARPNIILITVDSLRADHLGAYGDRRGLTPALDAFAAESSVYESAYAAAPWTLASLGSLFTLQPPSRVGVKAPPGEREPWYWRQAALTATAPLLSERLRAAGYVTAAEPTNPFLEAARGWRGFEVWARALPQDGPDWMTRPKVRGEEVTAGARAWLARNRAEPFFLWLHYMDPHGPYGAPTAPRTLAARYPQGWAGTEKWETVRRWPDKAKVADYQAFSRAMYAEEVRYLDRCLGTLLQELRRGGRWDRSLIVVTADHGEELFEHGGIGHGHSMHQELLRVPLLIKWPKGTPADRRLSQVVALPSLGAQVLAAAGARSAPADAWPALPRQAAQAGGEVYSESTFWGEEQTALTTEQWRVIYRPSASSPADRFEVYDRRRDPREQHNLAAAQAAPELRARLQALTEAAGERAREGARTAKPGTMSQEEARSLRALGYLR